MEQMQKQFRVMIVDDSVKDVEGLKKFVPWKELNCEIVCVADNGQMGYELALKYRPDLIITDISMPLKTGIEMTDMICNKLTDIAFIYMSCYSSFEYAKSAIRAGVEAYILKPIRIEEMVAAIKKVTCNISRSNEINGIYKKLNEQFENNKKQLRDNYLLSLIENDIYDEAQIEMFGIKNDIKYNIAICCIEYNNANTTNEVYMHRMYLRELILGCMPKGSYVLNLEHSKVVIIIPEMFVMEFLEEFQTIQINFNQVTMGSFSVYVAEDSVSLDLASGTFKELFESINANYFEKKNQVVYINDSILSEMTSGISLDIGELKTKIYLLLSDENADVNCFLNKYMPNKLVMNTNYIKSFSYYIVVLMNVYLMDNNMRLSDIFFDESMIWKKLSDFQSIVNVRQWLYNIISTVREHIFTGNQNDERYINMSVQIKKYIDENYRNDRVLEESTEQINISMSYANTIFREINKKTMFDYLVEKRIIEAKALLVQTDMKIYEIAKLVGYSSNTYFSTAFKNNTGMSPHKYREMQRKTV